VVSHPGRDAGAAGTSSGGGGAASAASAAARGAGPLFGTTSYVLPDALLPNVRLLAPLVDDIELVLFEGEESNLPSPEQVTEMARLAEEAGSGFTVHLPLDTGIGEPERVRRLRAQETCLRIMELAHPLRPHAFVMHPELPAAYLPPAPGQRPPRIDALPDDEAWRWLDALRESVARLMPETGGRPLALENLQYPYSWLDPLLEEYPLAVTADVGHLLLRGEDPAAHLERYAHRLAVVHLHALRGGDDHQDLSAFPSAELTALLRHPVLVAPPEPPAQPRPGAAGEGGTSVVVTLEVFGLEATVASLETLSRAVGCAAGVRAAAAAAAIRAAAEVIPAEPPR
jgi:sugar phosphate isomerase/epimerase